MQMQQLRYFLEIAKEKNISAAAKNLYLSQPSPSRSGNWKRNWRCRFSSATPNLFP